MRQLAIAAASAAVIGALSAPLVTWVSRAYEREAEWQGLAISRDPDAAIGLQQGFVRRSLGVPDPPEAVRVWFGTHPPRSSASGWRCAPARGRLSWGAGRRGCRSPRSAA